MTPPRRAEDCPPHKVEVRRAASPLAAAEVSGSGRLPGHIRRGGFYIRPPVPPYLTPASAPTPIRSFPQPKSAAAYPRSNTRGSAGSARWQRRSGSRHWANPRAEKINIWSAPAIGRIPRRVSPVERYCAHRSSHASGCSKSSGSTAQTW